MTLALTVEPLEVTRLLLELVLQLVGVLEDLLVLGRHEADVVLVHLQLLQRVNQLHLLGEQQLVLELGVNQLQRVRQREVVDLCDVTITQALMQYMYSVFTKWRLSKPQNSSRTRTASRCMATIIIIAYCRECYALINL